MIKKYIVVTIHNQGGSPDYRIEPSVPYKGYWKNEVTPMTFEDFATALNVAYTQGHIDTINGELNYEQTTTPNS